MECERKVKGEKKVENNMKEEKAGGIELKVRGRGWKNNERSERRKMEEKQLTIKKTNEKKEKLEKKI